MLDFSVLREFVDKFLKALVDHLEEPDQVRQSCIQLSRCEGIDNELPFVESIKVCGDILLLLHHKLCYQVFFLLHTCIPIRII